MNAAKLRRSIANLFKLRGINLCGDDCIYLAEQLAQFPQTEGDELIIKIIDKLQVQRLEHGQVTRAALELVIKDLQSVGLDEAEPVFEVLDAFNVPRFSYDAHTKVFKRDEQTRKVITDVRMKAEHLRQRYLMLLHKTQRNELFAPKIIENGVSEESRAKKSKLIFIEQLLSSSCLENVVVLGLLTQMKTGQYYLADLTGTVQVGLKNARFHSGFFCEGSFVLAEGNYSDNVLEVTRVGFPPSETAKVSYKYIGEHNTWGGKREILLKHSKRLAQIEYFNDEATIVFISDLRLDAPDVKNKLRQLFLGFDDFPPVAIVLMGPFSSTGKDINSVRYLLHELAELTERCIQLKQETDLVLIPANDDPAATDMLPRPPLPKSIAADLQKIWPRAILATNPCRLQYCTQQITVCKMDLMAKFCRYSVHFPENCEHLEEHLARTIICQGHLAPFLPLVTPVLWDFDSALWLYPLPDLVVLGDSCGPYQTTHQGCTVANPGSFSKSKFIFKVYYPNARRMEESIVN